MPMHSIDSFADARTARTSLTVWVSVFVEEVDPAGSDRRCCTALNRQIPQLLQRDLSGFAFFFLRVSHWRLLSCKNDGSTSGRARLDRTSDKQILAAGRGGAWSDVLLLDRRVLCRQHSQRNRKDLLVVCSARKSSRSCRAELHRAQVSTLHRVCSTGCVLVSRFSSRCSGSMAAQVGLVFASYRGNVGAAR